MHSGAGRSPPHVMAEDPTDLFASEADSAANPISLADVLAMRVPVHWTEAVAVIEALCHVLTERGDVTRVPDAADVVVTSHGEVMVHLGAPDIDDVDALGRTLNALLDPVTTPIPLRLFVAHSIGSERFRSVQAYGEALAYYASPDRAELIRALYLRCLQAAVVPNPNPVPVARAERVPPQVLAPDALRRRRVPRAAVIATAALVLLAIGAFAYRSQGGAAAAPLQTLRAAASSAATAVRQLVQVSTPGEASVPQEQPVERADAAPLAPPVRAPRARATRAGAPAAASSELVLSASADAVLSPLAAGTAAEGGLALPAPPVIRQPAGLIAEPAPGGPGPGMSLPAAAVPRVAVPAVDTTIYSSAWPDVQPPVMFSPKLPPVAPIDLLQPGTNTMELLIDETGAVQQARLTSRPVRMSDMIMLSPAKTWKFHPALKDGRPVKYRLTLSWVVAPP